MLPAAAYGAYMPSFQPAPRGVYLENTDTGKLIFEQNAGERMEAGYLAKLMTALMTVEYMEDSVRAAQDTSDSVLKVVDRAEEMGRLIDGIADYTRQQDENAAQITNGIEQISAVVQSNVATSEASAAASEELASQAAMLRELVARFRLREQ